MEAISFVAVICLLLVAVAFSPLGLGGGILYVPIMHYMLEWEIKESLVASLTLVLMVALGSSMAHSKSGHADKKVAKLGRISAVPSAVIGVILSGALLSAVGDIGIKIIAAIIVFFVIERTLRKTLSKDELETAEVPDIRKEKPVYCRIFIRRNFCRNIGNWRRSNPGDIEQVILKMDAKKAAGTSYLVAATITPVALVSHLILSRNLSTIVDDAGILAIIVVPILVFASAYFGAKYAIKYLPKQIVSYVFLFVVSVSLFRYLSDLVSQI